MNQSIDSTVLCRTIPITVLCCLVGCGPGSDTDGKIVDEMPPYAMPESGLTKEATEDDPQVVRGNVFEDYHYAFRLRRPSSDWRFLDEVKVQTMSPDAMMGMIHPGQHGFVVVIAEKMEDITLDDYVDLVVKNSAAAESRLTGRKRIQVDGHPGRVVTWEATTEGIELKFRLQFVQRDSYFYNLMAWTIASKYAQVEPSLIAIADSFELVKDRQPQTRSSVGSEDDYGVDWKIADGVYSNASFGFRLTPGEGFRLAGRIELAGMSPDAAAGVARTDPAFYQVLIIEPIGDMDHGQFTRLVLGQFEADLQYADDSPLVSTVEFGGVEAEQRIYRGVEESGTHFDFVQTFFYRDSVFFRLQSWWHSSEYDAALPHLTGSYRHLDWLSAAEQTSLETELTALDIDNAVGADFCCRNGVFHDFQFGYSLRQPSGLWQVQTGDMVLAQNEDARAIFNQPAEGIQVFVIPEMLDMDHESYHSLLQNSIDPTAAAPVRKQGQGDLELLVSSLRLSPDGLDMSMRLVTVVRGRRHLQILLSTLRSNEQLLDKYLPEVIAGLDVPRTSPRAINSTGAVLVDHRLGFQFASPDGTPVRDNTPPPIRPLGSLSALEMDNGACIAMAICPPAGFDEEMAIDAMTKSSEIAVDPGSRRESESTLGGLPARCFTMSGRADGRQAFMKVWMTKRANTFYMLLVVGEPGTRLERTADRYRTCFTLLD